MDNQTLQNFTHLHVHHEYSTLDGLGTAEKYCKRAIELGQKAISITDHGNVDGAIKFCKVCSNYGVKPIVGMEAYIVPDLLKKEKGEQKFHMNLLAMNNEGWQNLLRLCTIANMQGMYSRPRIDVETVVDYLDGVIVLTACSFGFLKADWGEDLLKTIMTRTPHVFLEVMPLEDEYQADMNKKCQRLSKKLGLDMVATNDVHYVLKEQWKYHEVLLAVQNKSTWNNPNRFKFPSASYYLKSANEMRESFLEQGILSLSEIDTAINNTQKVVDLIDFTVERVPVSLPRRIQIKGYPQKDNQDKLFSIVMDGFDYRMETYPYIEEKKREYLDRIEMELSLIYDLKFETYFLLVYDMIQTCKQKGIMVGPGRGSAAGSLVCYCLGITNIDSILYDLNFSRFLNKDRIDLPDIDIDFDRSRLSEIRGILEAKYGRHNIASVTTFTRMKQRSVLKDVARVFEIPLAEVDKAAKAIPPEITLEKAFEEIPECIDFKNKYSEYQIAEIAMELEGTIRGLGQHAAGLIVSSNDLRDGLNCYLAERGGETSVNWEKEDAEFMGLVKLDRLGLNYLTILNETRLLIWERTGYEMPMDFSNIPMDDAKVFAELAEGNTSGLFQISTWSGTNLCKDLRVKNFNDIVNIMALARPGTKDSGLTEEFIKRHNGKKWDRKHESYEQVTKGTLGIPIFQEQIMEIIYYVAGLSYETADKIRKIIAKKRDEKEFEKYKTQFVEGCIKMETLSKQEAEEFWESLLMWASYGFNKSHAVAYAMISYWTGWFKVNYPLEFIVALLTHGGDDNKQQYIDDAKKANLKILLPDINNSDKEKWVIYGDALLAPIMAVKGIGEVAAETIVKARKKTKPFESVEDIGEVCPARQVNSKVKGLLSMIEEAKKTKDYKSISHLFSYEIEADPMDRFMKVSKFTGKEANTFMQGIQLLKGNVEGLQLAKSTPKADLTGLDACCYCNLSNDKRVTPIQPLQGQFNIFVIMEAPYDEKIAFESSWGDTIFYGNKSKGVKGLSDYGFEKEDLHFTYLCKCWPRLAKKATESEMGTCANIWLSKEIKERKPYIMLAFGNSSMYYFKGESKGIVSFSGETEWSDKFNCWINYCISPAQAFYSDAPDMIMKFNEGIANFVDKVSKLGF